MAHPQSTKDELRRLYVFEQISLTMAAVMTQVSEPTATRWKKQAKKAGDDWDKLRAAHGMAGGDLEDVARQILTDFVLQFKATMDAIKTEEGINSITRVELLTSLADSYNKAIGANKKLLPETSKLAVALEVLTRLGDYIKQHKPELLMDFMAVLEPFGQTLEKELK